MAISAADQQKLIALVVGMFNAAPGKDVLDELEAAFEAGAPLSLIAESLALTDEYKSIYAEDLSNAAFATALVNNMVGDLVSATEKADAAAYIQSLLNAGDSRVDVTLIAIEALASVPTTDANWGAAAQALANKVEVATYYSVTQGVSSTDLATLQGVVADVDDTAASVTDAKAAIDADLVIGDTFELTTANDTITGTDLNDTITGVVSALSSANTLNAGDVILGGAGSDKLVLEVSSNFNGFTGDGKMEGVETVVLNSTGSVGRTVSLAGTKGVERVEIDASKGAISLSGMALGATVAVSGQTETGNFAINYASAATTAGTADVQNIEFSGLGALTAAGTASKTVTATIAGIETINLKLTGTNVANLTAANAATLNITGSGSLLMATSPAGLKKLNAADATGKLTVDLAAASGVTEVQMGSGDDTVTLDTTDDVTANAQLHGGAGNDKLVLKGGSTVQFTQSGFETVEVGALANALVYSGLNVTGVTKLSALAALDKNVTFANMGSGNMEVSLGGANATTNTVSTDHSGTTTVATAPAATATVAAPNVNKLNVTASKSTELSLNVAARSTYEGIITANEATSVAVAISGATANTAQIIAGKAESVVISSVANASTLKLTASKATEVQVTAAKDFTLEATSNLDAVQSLTISSATNYTGTGVALKALNVANLSGAGNITLGNLGTSSMDYSLTVNASNVGDLVLGTATTKNQSIEINAGSVVGDVTVGAVDAGTSTVVIDTNGTAGDVTLAAITGKTVTVDATNTLGDITYGGAITVGAGGTLTLKGASLKNNDWDTNGVVAGGTSLTTSVTGGLGDDKIKITADAGGSVLTVTGNLGTGTNAVTVNGGAARDQINLSGLTVNSGDASVGATITGGAGGGASAAAPQTIVGTAGNDTITVTAGVNTITGGKGADSITLGAGADTVVIAEGDTGITVATADNITGFSTTNDKLKLGVAGSATNFVARDGSDDANTATVFADALTAANTALNGTVRYALVSDGVTAAQSWLFIDRDLDGTADEVVILTGITSAQLVFGDIIA